MILMVNSINNNKKSLLLDAKELYLRKEYNNYLKNLIKNSNIKLFIWKTLEINKIYMYNLT